MITVLKDGINSILIRAIFIGHQVQGGKLK